MDQVAKTIRFPQDANDEANMWASRIGVSFNDYVILAVRHLNQAQRKVNKPVKDSKKKSSFSLGFGFETQDEIERSLIECVQ